jgi:hypothetical protein
MVIGWLLAHWLLTRGKLLSLYGIDEQRIGSARRTADGEDCVEQRIRAEQQAIHAEIQRLYEALSREANEWVATRIEHEMRLLDRQIRPPGRGDFQHGHPHQSSRGKEAPAAATASHGNACHGTLHAAATLLQRHAARCQHSVAQPRRLSAIRDSLFACDRTGNCPHIAL